MCGIAGFLTRAPAGIEVATIRRAVDSLEHRGPDDFGFLSLAPQGNYLGRDFARHPRHAWLSLVHRRLAILDRSPAGRQPMATEDGRHHIVFNGEIYNYLELRAELEALGHSFRSDTDTEVLLKACVQWGAAALNRLVGMFAFALLDTQERRLFLARDFFGIKPLFYCLKKDGFAFASELKVLIDHLSTRRVNAERLYQYLCFGLTDHGDQTLFEDIRQLPAAHYLEVDLRRPADCQPVRYWRLEIDRPLQLSFAEATTRLRELFLESVALHLRSDVPVGAALSGGIDSSAIVMAMRELTGRRLDLHVFSYVADDDSINEEHWIDLVGSAAGAEVHKVHANTEELVDDLTEVTRLQDEPFGSTSICMQSRVFRRAQQCGIKVMLDGQGADELLAGYRPYQGAKLAGIIRRGALPRAARFWWKASQQPGSGKWWLAARAGNFLLPHFCRGWARQHVMKDVRPPWLNDAWFAAHGVRHRVAPVPRRGEILREQLRQSIEELSIPQLLRYEDRNSMAASVESRVPFLTPQLASFVLSLPEHYLIAQDGTSKYVFREAMRGIVPDPILDRKDKIGFATPERHWLTALRPWVESILSSESAAAVQALSMPEATREWRRMVAGQKRWSWSAWRWLNLIEWSRQHQVAYP
jgi:asparagine synthase (glutamine-hydrolysing)